MRIQTGQGTIPLITLIGIWSISALNALPGLAVSPILGKLSAIFLHATELDIQMLSSLPSLLIIPFIILSGKLTEKINNIWLLQIGLSIFAVSGILYLLSTKMWQLIAVSALLGIGSGLIVPLSTGLISRFFIGAYRTKQFGLSSAITNVTLVLATVLTGYLAEINWHLPFLVYLFPLISIVLSFYLKKSEADANGECPVKEYQSPARFRYRFNQRERERKRPGIREIRHTGQTPRTDHGVLRAGDLSRYHCQFQPAFPDERISFHQRQFGYHDLPVFPGYHGSGIRTEPDCRLPG